MDIHQNLEAITMVALHHAKEHDCNYNVIISNPIDGEFGDGSTYEYVADSYFKKERDCILVMKTDDEKEEELPVKIEKNSLYGEMGEGKSLAISNESMEISEQFIDFSGHFGHGMSRPRIEPRRVEKLPGRNEPCPCESGKKYKKCCIN